MDVGQRVKVIYALDSGKEGKVIGEHTKVVPPAILQVGGDYTPTTFCKIQLDDGHTNLYPLDWVESI